MPKEKVKKYRPTSEEMINHLNKYRDFYEDQFGKEKIEKFANWLKKTFK